jgi:hypothetical protein
MTANAKRALPLATADALIDTPHECAPDDKSASQLRQSLDQARDRLDRSVKLLAWALDLREALWFTLDLGDMQEAVRDLKRAVDLHRRSA